MINKAMALNPGLAGVQVALGRIHTTQGNMSNKLTLRKGANGTNGCEPDDKTWKPKKMGK